MKRIISRETATMVAVEANKPGTKVEPFMIPNYFAIGIGAILVVRTGDEHYLDLKDQDVTKAYMKDWNQDIGKILCKDYRKKNYSSLYLMTTPKHKVLLRRIAEDELNNFTDNGLRDVLIGDYFYTIVKILTNDEHDVWGSVDKVEENFVEAMEKEAADAAEEQELVEEEELESMSLF